jgi:hypothetical protein
LILPKTTKKGKNADFFFNDKNFFPFFIFIFLSQRTLLARICPVLDFMWFNENLGGVPFFFEISLKGLHFFHENKNKTKPQNFFSALQVLNIIKTKLEKLAEETTEVL